ncbi:MAG: AsnC family transcriptional regulator [Rhodobacterales bacterium]|nr:MAG: AsnC family transcriptional regulator [Rhodobacterales bacterium]
MLDDMDRRLLRLWQSDPDLSIADLADQAGMTASRAARRIERLREQGVFRGRRAVIDWRALGYEVTVSLRITLDKTRPRAFEDFTEAARKVPEVIEIQTFLGRVDLRLSVIARDMAHYQAIWRDQLLALPHISDIEGLMTVTTLKDDPGLPV